MGLSWTKLWEGIGFAPETRILMFGLDAVGKTTILYKLKLGKVIHTLPTAGFNVETIQHKGLQLSLWDTPSKQKMRPLWRHYVLTVQGIIFVVDSNDRERIEEAKEDLFGLLEDNELHGVSLLVFANKQDMSSAMSVAEVTEKLSLQSLQQSERRWFVQAASAWEGKGLYEGLDWLSMNLAHMRQSS